jgi:hypothetical protein
MKGPQIAVQTAAAHAAAQVIWGLMWIMLAESHDGGAPAVRRTTRAPGCHATLVRAPPPRASASISWSPETPRSRY